MRSFLVLSLVILGSLHASAEQFLIKYKSPQVLNEIQTFASNKSNDVQVIDHHEPGSYVVVETSQTESGLKSLFNQKMNQEIEWIVPNFKLHRFDNEPNDLDGLRQQWALQKIQALRAWKRVGNKGSKNVIVAVIDTGVDYNHKNLTRNMIKGYDFADNDDNPMDDTSSSNPGHGTHCAGIIGADGLVNEGISGLIPQVTIMPLRFLGKNGSGDLNNGIKSIDFAIEKGAHVISASWGASVNPAQARALIEAVKRASDRGVIFVTAAANDGKNNDKVNVYPTNANFENTITVAASSSNDSKPYWSNYGKSKVHIAAPGDGIMSTLPSDSYGNLSGTSMATPLVAGLVAFLKSQDMSLTGAEILALMQTTGTKVNIETACQCRIDAFAAADHLAAQRMWVVPSAMTLTTDKEIPLKIKNASQSRLTFTSSAPDVVAVNDQGVIKALKRGTAQITVADANGQKVTTSDFISMIEQQGDDNDRAECPHSPQTCERVCRWFPWVRYCKK